VRLKLSDEDRERLGAPEWIEYDPTRLMLDEAIAIQDHTGYGPDELGDALRGTPVVRHGEPVMGPGGRQRMRRDLRAWQSVVWVALHRAGVQVALPDLTFDLIGLDVGGDEEPGKGDADDQSTQPEASDS